MGDWGAVQFWELVDAIAELFLDVADAGLVSLSVESGLPGVLGIGIDVQ